MLNINIERAVTVINKSFGAVAYGEAINRILYQLKISAIHRDRPEPILQSGRNFILFEMENVVVLAIQQIRIAVLVGAEVLRLFAVVHKKTFERSSSTVEVIKPISAGPEIIPTRRIRCPPDTSPSTS